MKIDTESKEDFYEEVYDEEVYDEEVYDEEVFVPIDLRNLSELQSHISKFYQIIIYGERILTSGLIIPADICHIPLEELPRTITIRAVLETEIYGPAWQLSDDEIEHHDLTCYVNLKSDGSISLIPQKESLVPLLLRQMDLWDDKIDFVYNHRGRIIYAPEQLYFVLDYFAKNKIETKYGIIDVVLNMEETLSEAKEIDEENYRQSCKSLLGYDYDQGYYEDVYISERIFVHLK